MVETGHFEKPPVGESSCIDTLIPVTSVTESGESVDNTVHCSRCELCFKDVEEYERHRGICKKKHSCRICNATFQRYDHLKRHMLSVHSNTKYICPACGNTSENHETLMEHIKIHPDEAEIDCCRNCNEECKTLQEFVEHECEHFLPEKHVCSFCSRVFKRRDHMLRHIQTLHLQRHTMCPICHHKFKRKDHVVRHMREKHKMVISNGKLKGIEGNLASSQD